MSSVFSCILSCSVEVPSVSADPVGTADFDWHRWHQLVIDPTNQRRTDWNHWDLFFRHTIPHLRKCYVCFLFFIFFFFLSFSILFFSLQNIRLMQSFCLIVFNLAFWILKSLFFVKVNYQYEEIKENKDIKKEVSDIPLGTSITNQWFRDKTIGLISASDINLISDPELGAFRQKFCVLGK